MKIAHLSDLHVLDLRGVPASRWLFNKRLTGMVNLSLKRGHTHKRQIAEALIDDLRERSVDHVIVTGDLTNLGLETEFSAAREVLSRLSMPATNVTVVPGNHDLYTSGVQRARRFESFFSQHITTDITSSPVTERTTFPFVRLRGPVAIIGLSTAVPRPPLVSSGVVGRHQLQALTELLSHPEVSRRWVVLAAHHPIVNSRGLIDSVLRGLYDASALRDTLSLRSTVYTLHGHHHRRVYACINSPHGSLSKNTLQPTESADCKTTKLYRLGATSASLLHPDPDRMAAYNLYDFDPDLGLVSVTSRVWNPLTYSVIDAPLSQQSY